MKKIFSILAVLVLLIAFYPSKVDAKVCDCDEYKIYDDDSNYCQGTGGKCVDMPPVIVTRK